MTIDNLEQQLHQFLGDAKKIAILGIGNSMRQDDGLGPFIIDGLNIPDPNVYIENVGSVPEAFARPLSEFGAERVILIDAADMRKPVGHVELIVKDRIGGIAISTHHMPLSFLMMYLEEVTGAETVLLGIQPQSIDFGEGLTSEVEEVSRKVIVTLNSVLTQHLRGNENVSNN